jgi:hypothetical protein
LQVGAVGLLAEGMNQTDTLVRVDNIEDWPDSGSGTIGLESFA